MMASNMFTELTADDLATVVRQLGRKITGQVRVARRDEQGCPMVLATAPLRRMDRRVTPYADLYWLTCPTRSRDLARQESVGTIGRIESQLHDDPDAMSALMANHRTYVATRRAWGETMIGVDDSTRSMLDLLDERGIGGVMCWSSVKCLHAHVAYDLVHGDGVVRAILRGLS